MAKRLTPSEQKSHDLVETLIKRFNERLAKGVQKEILYAAVSSEIGVSVRTLKYWVSRGKYPLGLGVMALERWVLAEDA